MLLLLLLVVSVGTGFSGSPVIGMRQREYLRCFGDLEKLVAFPSISNKGKQADLNPVLTMWTFRCFGNPSEIISNSLSEYGSGAPAQGLGSI